MVADANSGPNGAAPAAEEERWLPETALRELKHRPEAGTDSPVPFFHAIELLKINKREGWNRFSVHQPESISDHMYRMGIMTMLAPAGLREKLDIPRCTQMALVHDMAESLVGDITPVDGVPKSEKSRRERTTMEFLCQGLLGQVNGGLAGSHMRDLWEEYEANETLESKFVHDVDKIELVLQMLEYERREGGSLDIGEFTWVAKRVLLPECREWTVTIIQEREKFWEPIGKPDGFTLDEIRTHWDLVDQGLDPERKRS